MAAMTDFDLDPEEVRRLGRLAADCVAEHRARLTERPVFGKVGPDAATFDMPAPGERPAGRRDHRLRPRARDAAADGQLAPAVLRLHQRVRRSPRHRRRLPGLGDEPELLGRRPRGGARREPGGALALRADGLPRGRAGHPRVRRLDGQLHRAGRRAPGHDARQRPRRRPGRRAAPRGLRLRPGPLLRGQGGRPARHRHALPAEDSLRRGIPPAHGRARAPRWPRTGRGACVPPSSWAARER